jgi:hypothetical protein
VPSVLVPCSFGFRPKRSQHASLLPGLLAATRTGLPLGQVLGLSVQAARKSTGLGSRTPAGRLPDSAARDDPCGGLPARSSMEAG